MPNEDDGFSEAFDELFARAFRLCRRMVGDAPTAEDLAAEALARAYARWPKVKGLAHRDAWVLRVASNLAVDTVRRRARRRVEGAESYQATPDDRLVLKAALRRLPARQREVVVLRHFSDLSEQEVADVLGITVGSVKTHNHRALAALRTQLADLEEVGFGVL